MIIFSLLMICFPILKAKKGRMGVMGIKLDLEKTYDYRNSELIGYVHVCPF